MTSGLASFKCFGNLQQGPELLGEPGSLLPSLPGGVLSHENEDEQRDKSPSNFEGLSGVANKIEQNLNSYIQNFLCTES